MKLALKYLTYWIHINIFHVKLILSLIFEVYNLCFMKSWWAVKILLSQRRQTDKKKLEQELIKHINQCICFFLYFFYCSYFCSFLFVGKAVFFLPKNAWQETLLNWSLTLPLPFTIIFNFSFIVIYSYRSFIQAFCFIYITQNHCCATLSFKSSHFSGSKIWSGQFFTNKNQIHTVFLTYYCTILVHRKKWQTGRISESYRYWERIKRHTVRKDFLVLNKRTRKKRNRLQKSFE